MWWQNKSHISLQRAVFCLSFSEILHKKCIIQCVFVYLQKSSTELLQKVCEVVERGLEALAKGVATLLPQDYSAITDSAFIQVGSQPVQHSIIDNY